MQLNVSACMTGFWATLEFYAEAKDIKQAHAIKRPSVWMEWSFTKCLLGKTKNILTIRKSWLNIIDVSRRRISVVNVKPTM